MSERNEVLLNAPQNQESRTVADAVRQYIGRTALAISLVVGGGGAAGVAESMIGRPAPAHAETTFSNDYPDQNAMDHRPSLAEWWKDENGNGQKNITDNIYTDNDETMSPRGYYYRNCTDGTSYWTIKYTGYNPAGWGNAERWETAATAAGRTVKAGNSNNIEPGDIAQSDDGAVGHVGFVTEVTKDGSGNVTSFRTAELNKTGIDGNYSAPSANLYNTRNAAGKFSRAGSNDWDNFIDVNGANKGLNNEVWPSGGGGAPPPDPLNLTFTRLNHPSGNVEVVSYSESSNYQQLTENPLTGYPAVPPDGTVVPLFQRDGDLSFVRLNHPSGRVEVATYSEASGYRNLIGLSLTGYPSVPGNGAVIPLYQYDGDLSFIRLNHSSGNVEVVAYSEASNFQTLSESRLTSYPAVAPDGAVVPLYWLNDDLVLIRLNHTSGRVELASYSKASSYRQLVNYQLLPYPAVNPDGAVVPMFQPQDGDLSFVRLNHYSGHPEVITYGVGSGFQQLIDNDLVSYPAVAPNTGVMVRYSN